MGKTRTSRRGKVTTAAAVSLDGSGSLGLFFHEVGEARRSPFRFGRVRRGLVGELNLRITPVIVGDGLRLFPEHGPTHDLELVESRSTSSGVMIQTYRPNGRAIFGPAG